MKQTITTDFLAGKLSSAVKENISVYWRAITDQTSAEFNETAREVIEKNLWAIDAMLVLSAMFQKGFSEAEIEEIQFMLIVGYSPLEMEDFRELSAIYTACLSVSQSGLKPNLEQLAASFLSQVTPSAYQPSNDMEGTQVSGALTVALVGSYTALLDVFRETKANFQLSPNPKLAFKNSQAKKSIEVPVFYSPLNEDLDLDHRYYAEIFSLAPIGIFEFTWLGMLLMGQSGVKAFTVAWIVGAVYTGLNWIAMKVGETPGTRLFLSHQSIVLGPLKPIMSLAFAAAFLWQGEYWSIPLALATLVGLPGALSPAQGMGILVAKMTGIHIKYFFIREFFGIDIKIRPLNVPRNKDAA